MALLNESSLASTDEFKRLTKAFGINTIIAQTALLTKRSNYCESCDIAMEVISPSTCVCPQCGSEQALHEGPRSIGSATVTTEADKSSENKHGTSVDSAQAQRKALKEQLTKNQIRYTNNGGVAFNEQVLEEVVTQYNVLQGLLCPDKSGNFKTFVKRATVRNSLIAALIKLEHKRRDLYRKDEDIAIFMNLKTVSFSKSTNELARIARYQGLSNVDINPVSIESFVTTYMDKLNIMDVKYRLFIHDLVAETENQQLSITSKISSKVAGAIWVLIVNMELPIESSALEIASDKRKNTFIKFSNTIWNNKLSLAKVFYKHGIKM